MRAADLSALRRIEIVARGVVRRGILTAVQDGKRAQALQVQISGDPSRPQVLDLVEHAQPYGLSAKPLAGAEAIVVALGGAAEAAVAVQVADRRYRRKNLLPGEVALHDHQGNRVVIRQGGLVHVVAASEVHLVAPLVRVTGDLLVQGNITATGEVSDSAGTSPTLTEMRAAYNAHVHGASGPPSPPM